MLDGTLANIPTSTTRNGTKIKLSDRERFDLGLLEYRKNLKAYACSLSRDAETADELVQDTLLKAVANRDKFDCDTNLRAWLFTILRNVFRSKLRREKHEVELTDAMTRTALFATKGAQEDALLLKEVAQRMSVLPESQKIALILVGAHGYSIKEVARRAGCKPGTVKSRVNRARRAMMSNLD
ncbi:sigma-70 family RNA polymerase sigma factor [Aliiroseovarius sp. Z3]|uniref:sigma-70 family RNA polymerase sigma factor n=1 Tax=Aliiroseovarius sp. Z3 TaxID=2811402 RepID=UPI0023B33F86|nr:sigma-70 family RNA polymerase sigma factor [Aliiroseovarius sp. Z3]MDE9449940.1 sigma-70 family RNA polymerase sigma factor [Aliiroseovarius sp. Z3]